MVFLTVSVVTVIIIIISRTHISFNINPFPFNVKNGSDVGENSIKNLFFVQNDIFSAKVRKKSGSKS